MDLQLFWNNKLISWNICTKNNINKLYFIMLKKAWNFRINHNIGLWPYWYNIWKKKSNTSSFFFYILNSGFSNKSPLIFDHTVKIILCNTYFHFKIYFLNIAGIRLYLPIQLLTEIFCLFVYLSGICKFLGLLC